MNEFRTEITPAVSSSPVGLKDAIFTIGSCFADAMGSHLHESKFNVWNNHFGTIYNPVSIHQALLFGLENKLPGSGYVHHEGIHFNYHFHSSFSSVIRQELEIEIKDAVAKANQFLKDASRVVITYGTSFVYRSSTSNEIVANCHKVPGANFTKSLLTEAEIVQSFQAFYTMLRAINPLCRIILTVSPVRHLKDTLPMNAVSKSVLRLSCHSIVNAFTGVEYFPAYEILLDDLRDYRFYKTDRLHPTDEAIEYIWQKFVNTYLDDPSKKFIDNWKEIARDLAHKPFHAQSESHHKFLQSTLKKIEALQTQADLSVEMQHVKAQIANSKWLIS